MTNAQKQCPKCDKPLPENVGFCPSCGSATPTSTFKEPGTPPQSVIGEDSAFELQISAALGADYELGERIGLGGFGAVYRARDLKLKRDIAVKVMRADLASNPGLRDRFQREAESVASLRHPNILPIYSIGEAEGLVYFVMPLIQGKSLADLLAEGMLPLDESRRIVAEIASALAEAHRVGLVHRDIKPDNILLEGPEQRALVMDFGIAKAIDSRETKLTATGMIVGTPQYMSPEQASGDEHVDHRTDIYSLGVMAYQMFAGVPLFEGASARSVIVKHITTEPEDLAAKQPELPLEVARAVMRSLAKEPEDRWQSSDDFAAAVRAPAVTGEVAPRSGKNKTLPVAGVTAIVLIAILLVVFWPEPSAPMPEPADTAPALPATVVEISGGTYAIGGNEAHSMSRPEHTVTLQPFAIELTEVTRADYREFLGSAVAMGFGTPPGVNEGDLLPVTGVYWNEAVAYCAWKYPTGHLPSEQQWEAAARGHDGRSTPWSDEQTGNVANVQSSANNGPAPVGSYRAGATPEGVLDLIGNVWEWTSSRLAPYPGGSPIDIDGIHYIIRGGAFNTPDDVATSTRRGYLPARLADRASIAATGFRCTTDLN